MNHSPYAIRGKLLLGSGLVEGAVVIEEDRIAELARFPYQGNLPEQVIEAEIVSPGFIDIQINGAFGKEVGREADTIEVMAEKLPASGTTAFLPTLPTAEPETYDRFFEHFEASRTT